MRQIVISGYSLNPGVYEDILHHAAATNSVEEGLWVIKANESKKVIETSHITCYVLAIMKILFVDKMM
jgi:hypothetical protein